MKITSLFIALANCLAVLSICGAVHSAAGGSNLDAPPISQGSIYSYSGTTHRHLLDTSATLNSSAYHLPSESEASSDSPSENIHSGRTARVAYGKNATTSKFPFAVQIVTGAWTCTGSLINPRVALTSAYCVIDKGKPVPSISVKAGSVNLDDAVEYGVAKAIVPNQYNEANGFYANIALLELSRGTTTTPLALASPTTRLGRYKSVLIAGFGKNQDDIYPGVLQYASLPILSTRNCQVVYSKTFGKTLPEDHYCFGLQKSPATDSCGGDDGAPLMVLNGKKVPVEVALSSYGVVKGCAPAGQNAVFGLSIPKWRSWIDDMRSFYNLYGLIPPIRRNILYEGKCYKGPVLKSFKIKSQSTCVEDCRNNLFCKYWTWRTNSTCYLYSKFGGSLVSDKCISGAMSAGPV